MYVFSADIWALALFIFTFLSATEIYLNIMYQSLFLMLSVLFFRNEAQN